MQEPNPYIADMGQQWDNTNSAKLLPAQPQPSYGLMDLVRDYQLSKLSKMKEPNSYTSNVGQEWDDINTARLPAPPKPSYGLMDLIRDDQWARMEPTTPFAPTNPAVVDSGLSAAGVPNPDDFFKQQRLIKGATKPAYVDLKESNSTPRIESGNNQGVAKFARFGVGGGGPIDIKFAKEIIENHQKKSSGANNQAGVYRINPNSLGQPVNSKRDFANLSTVDLLARILYCEAGDGEYALEAVAWTIINRYKQGGWTWDENADSTENSLRNIVLTPLQYAGLTGERDQPDGNPNALNKDGKIDLNSLKWRQAVAIASQIVNDPDNITKPDEFKKINYTSFLAKHQFDELPDGNYSLWGKTIRNSALIGGNRFFIDE